MEVRKGEALAGIQTDFVRCGRKSRVGHVLQHVAGEDGECAWDGGHVDPVRRVFVAAGGGGGPVGEGVG